MSTAARHTTILHDGLWILSLSLALHLGVAQFYPMIYGHDSIVRLMNRNTIWLSYQLPLFQILLVALGAWSPALIAVRLLLGLLGGLAAFGLYALTSSLLDRSSARVAAFLFCVHPFLLFYSLVPYQEILMLALLFPSVYFTLRFVRENRWSLLATAAIFSNLACLTRYEAWIVALALGAYVAFRHRDISHPFGRYVLVAAVYGMVPLAWIIWNSGINPGGSYVLDFHIGLERFYRWYFVLRKAIGGTTSATTVFAVLGMVFLLRRRVVVRRERRLLGWIAVAFFLALLFSAHNFGDTQVVTEREAHLLIPYLLVPAAWAIVLLVRQADNSADSRPAKKINRAAEYLGRRGFLMAAILCTVAVYSLKELRGRIEFARHQDGLEISYQVALALDGLRAPRPGDAVVFAAPTSEEQIKDYLDRVERAQGAEGLRKARQTLAQMDSTPLDFQRIVVHSSTGRTSIRYWEELHPDRLFSTGSGRPRYWVVFSDFAAPDEEFASGLQEVVKLGREMHYTADGGKWARIYDISAVSASRR